jgi:hypothetical protein
MLPEKSPTEYSVRLIPHLVEFAADSCKPSCRLVANQFLRSRCRSEYGIGIVNPPFELGEFLGDRIRPRLPFSKDCNVVAFLFDPSIRLVDKSSYALP